MTDRRLFGRSTGFLHRPSSVGSNSPSGGVEGLSVACTRQKAPRILQNSWNTETNHDKPIVLHRHEYQYSPSLRSQLVFQIAVDTVDAAKDRQMTLGWAPSALRSFTPPSSRDSPRPSRRRNVLTPWRRWKLKDSWLLGAAVRTHR